MDQKMGKGGDDEGVNLGSREGKRKDKVGRASGGGGVCSRMT